MNPCGVKATKIWGHLLLNIIQPLLTHAIGLEAKIIFWTGTDFGT